MKTRSIQRWLQAAVLILPLTLAAACGPTIAPTAVRGDTGLPAAETPQADPATPTTEPEAEPSEDDATPEATPRPTETEDGPGLPPARDPDSEGTPVPVNPDVEAPNAVTDAVREAAARQAGATEEDVTVILATPTEFPSSALGCPEPDTSYSDVIVPGYIVVVEVDGERYEFHTDATGWQLVLCEQPVAGRDLEEASVTADEALVQAASEYLSETTGLDVSDLTLVTAEEVEWPDASLGCPQSGMMYAQVITPGYRLVFETPEGEQLEVHSNADGSTLVACENEGESRGGDLEPVGSTPAADEEVAASNDEGAEPGEAAPARVRDAALQAVADASGIAIDELEVVASEAVTWSDSSLGCPQPGQMYLQVITPGYRLTIRAGDTTFDVHTDERGYAIICRS